MCVEPYIYNTAAHRDNFTDVRYVCFVLRATSVYILFFIMLGTSYTIQACEIPE
jgi:hypothetical protein